MSRITRGARLALLLAAVGVGAGAATAAVRHDATSQQLRTTDKVVICHANGSGAWVQLDTPVNQIIGDNGHEHHPNDIIPPFDYDGGSFPGLNWDPTGIETYDNGCVRQTPHPEPIGVFVACGNQNGTTYDAVFGYNSANDADVTIAIGGANSVQPGGPAPGQPTVFHHGTVSSAFTVAGIPIANQVTWTVTYAGGTSTATSKFADCGVPPPVEPHVTIFVVCTVRGATTFDAVFGYTDPGPVEVNVPIGDANNVEPGGPDRHQPESFTPGRVADAFTVAGIPNGTTVTWTLTSGGSTATAVASDSLCVSPPTVDPVTPFVQCVQNRDSTYDATFGYSNTNADPVTIPIGDHNSVSPGGPGRGQPETFAPGTENSAFTVTGIPQGESVAWTLSTVPPVTAAATATASFETKCNQPPETPAIGIFVRCVTNNGATFDATFGYQNDNLDAETMPVGDLNHFAPEPADRRQTTTFGPGNVQEAFTVSGIPTGQDLVWTVVSNATRSATASSSFETKCGDPPPPATPIGVFVTCVVKHNSSYDAVFGYQNDNTVAEAIPIGPGNAFDPPPIARGQPIIFVPGRTLDAVTVTGIPSTQSLTWTLAYDGTRAITATLGSSATANPSSPLCPTPPTPPKPDPPDPPGPKPPEPPRVVGIFPACVLNHGATYDSVFGYANLNVGAVVVPIGSRNFVRPGADDQGQPETFQPGFVPAAFAVRGVPAGQSVSWTLKIGDETRVATAIATLPRKCPTAPIGPIPDLKITKKARPLAMYVGQRVVFTIVVTNIGRRPVRPVVVTDVRLDDRVEVLSTSTSLGRCRVSASASANTTACGSAMLAPGESATVRIVGRAVAPGRSRDRAVPIRILDATPANNVARASVLIRARPHPRRKPPFTG